VPSTIVSQSSSQWGDGIVEETVNRSDQVIDDPGQRFQYAVDRAGQSLNEIGDGIGERQNGIVSEAVDDVRQAIADAGQQTAWIEDGAEIDVRQRPMAAGAGKRRAAAVAARAIRLFVGSLLHGASAGLLCRRTVHPALIGQACILRQAVGPVRRGV